jgi:hypothetical protein
MPAAVPLIGVAAGVYGANQQSRAARDAARAGQQGADAEIGERQRQFDLSRQDQMPFMQAGYGALARQEQFLRGDTSGFENSADYVFNRNQMQQGLERGAAARGRLYSGGTGVDLAQQLSGLASNQANNYWNRLAGQAGQGQTTAANLGQLGMNMANGNANSIGNATAARQSGYQNAANARTGAGFGAAGAFNDWYQNNSANNGGGSGWYLGQRPGAG